ncbi:reverse transcriptase domain-containing protein, partial [Staphylococcus nepalensis]|nr:reverse transcriptase domain-containing protein [Staphylococcus nepalensis]
LLIISNNIDGIKETKLFLSSTFKMKDLGEVDTILDIKVKKDSESFTLSQSHYVDSVINKFKHLNIKEANTPIDPNINSIKNE